MGGCPLPLGSVVTTMIKWLKARAISKLFDPSIFLHIELFSYSISLDEILSTKQADTLLFGNSSY